MPKTPSYRQRKGYEQAIVTLMDSATKRRRDFWLGDYGTPESREAHHQVIAAWEANGRRWPSSHGCRWPSSHVESLAPGRSGGPTIAEIIREYWRWASTYYHPTRGGAVKTMLRILREYFGHTPAEQFGPKKLRLLREEMIRGNPNANPPRPSWSRKYVNSQIQCLRHLLKWAAAREMASVTVHQALCTLEPLKRGRTTARENTPVKPVPENLLDGVRPFLSRPVRAVVELQLLTGERPGECMPIGPSLQQGSPVPGAAFPTDPAFFLNRRFPALDFRHAMSYLRVIGQVFRCVFGPVRKSGPSRCRRNGRCEMVGFFRMIYHFGRATRFGKKQVLPVGHALNAVNE